MEAVPDTQITIFYSSVSGNMIMKRKQQHIFDTLQAKRVPNVVAVDVAASNTIKEYLRQDSPLALELPQIWVGKEFVGGHEQFENALEGEYLVDFLKISTAETYQVQKE